MAKKKYTNATRKAYYSGMGYRIAHDGKVIAKRPRKYPKLKK